MENLLSMRFLTIFFVVLILLCWVIIMLNNFRKRSEFNVKIDLADNEKELDRIDLSGQLTRENTLLTTRRLIQFKKHWWRSSLLSKFLPLENINSISLKHIMNLSFFILGIILYFIFAPLGYALILYALVAQMLVLEFRGETNHIRIGIGGISLESSHLMRFLNAIQRQAYSVKEQFATVGTTALNVVENEGMNFQFTLSTAIGILLFAILGLFQRITENKILFDDYVFFPLYLAIPAIIGAKWEAKDGFTAGFFGFWALYTVMYPFPALGLFAEAHIEAPFYIARHYLAASLLLGLIGLSAKFLWKQKELLTVLALLCWVIFIIIFQPSNLLDLSLYAQLFIGMGWLLIGLKWIQPGKEFKTENAF